MIHIEQVSLKFEPRDLWVGIYWDVKDPGGRCKAMKNHLFWWIPADIKDN